IGETGLVRAPHRLAADRRGATRRLLPYRPEIPVERGSDRLQQLRISLCVAGRLGENQRDGVLDREELLPIGCALRLHGPSPSTVSLSRSPPQLSKWSGPTTIYEAGSI